MNVYDFDGTIYNGDSTIDFYFYCLKKKPLIIFCLPKQMWGCALYLTKRIPKKIFKEYFFTFLKMPHLYFLLINFNPLCFNHYC